MNLTKEEQKVINKRKKLARIDTRVLQEFGKMINPKQCRFFKRRKVKKIKKKLMTLNAENPRKTYKQLDKLINNLEDLIDADLDLETEVIIARCQSIALSLYNDIQTTITCEVCKKNKILSECVNVGNFYEKGFGYDTRNLIKHKKGSNDIYK